MTNGDTLMLTLARWIDLRERLALVRTLGDKVDTARVAALEEETLALQTALARRFDKLPA